VKWTGFTLINLQSWVNIHIELNKDGLTVLEAPSQTGKSVFVKAIKTGTGYNEISKDVSASLIRNFEDWKSPSDNGILVIHLEGKAEVKFSFYIDRMATIVTNELGVKRAYMGPADEETMQMLELVQCKGSTRILNILDNEDKILFDGTDSAYNNSVLQVFLTHKELENRKENSIELLSRVKSSIAYKRKELLETTKSKNFLPARIDIERTRRLMDTLKLKNKLMTGMENLQVYMDKIISIQDVHVVDCESVLHNLIELKSKSKMIYKLSEIMEKKRPCSISTCTIDSLYSRLESLKILAIAVKELHSTRELEKGVEIENIDEMGTSLCSLKNKSNVLENLYGIEMLKNKNKITLKDIELNKLENDLANLKSRKYIIGEFGLANKLLDSRDMTKSIPNERIPEITNLKVKSELIYNIFMLVNIHDGIKETEHKSEVISELKNKYIQKNPVCPNCGQDMGGVE